MNITMINKKKHCPKCEGEMIQGFVPDYSHAAILIGSWHEGSPKKSFWTKTKAPFADGLPIGAFRCEKCGFLEFYADANFAAQ